jgi:opacity protein-like surface antigen
MRSLLAGAVVLLMAGPAFAQGERAFVNGSGGFAVSPDGTSGNILGEVGYRIVPKLSVFGDFGQFHNLQPSDIQAAVTTSTTDASNEGLIIAGEARVPAWYTVGGLRYDLLTHRGFTPYVLGGVGLARLTPSAQFTYTSGPLPDGTTSTAGSDVTSDLLGAGLFVKPPSSSALMMTFGGGLAIPIAQHVSVDTAYRYSRVNADTPVNAQGMTFGIGYRF